MKGEDLIILGGGVIAAFIIWRTLKKPVLASSATSSDYVNRITKADGWEYYTNGTAIAPNGDYYHQGELIWRAAS